MKKKNYSYIELIRLSDTCVIERVCTTHLTDKKHLEILNDIQCNGEVFRIDETITKIKHDEIVDETSIIVKYFNKNSIPLSRT